MKKGFILFVCVLMVLMSEVECQGLQRHSVTSFLSNIFEFVKKAVHVVVRTVTRFVATSWLVESVCGTYFYLEKCTDMMDNCGFICDTLDLVCGQVASISDITTTIWCDEDATVYSVIKDKLIETVAYWVKRGVFK